jgi:hypothetical protein
MWTLARIEPETVKGLSHRFGFVLTLFILLSFIHVGRHIWAQDQSWQLTPGVLIASGSRSHRVKYPEGTILSLDGARLTNGKPENVSIYHALIFSPAAIDSRTSRLNVGPISIQTLVWRDKSGGSKNTDSRVFEIKYDALEKSVTIGSLSFPLSAGNLFLIRLDEMLNPVTTQAQAHLSERAEIKKILRSFKEAFPDDKEIEALEPF